MKWMQTSQPQYLGELFDVCRNRSRGNTESAQAFQAIKDRLTAAQERVFKAIKTCGSIGATNDEICRGLGLTPNQVSPRLTELKMAGKITRCGTRPTRSGCPAAVWRAI